jgi:hypothetical protein
MQGSKEQTLSLLRWLNGHSSRNAARESGEKAYLGNQNLSFKEVGLDTIDCSDIYVFHLRLIKKKREHRRDHKDYVRQNGERETERVNNIM